MNRIYRLVWNKATNQLVAVSENSSGRSKSGSKAKTIGMVLAASLVSTFSVNAFATCVALSGAITGPYVTTSGVCYALDSTAAISGGADGIQVTATTTGIANNGGSVIGTNNGVSLQNSTLTGGLINNSGTISAFGTSGNGIYANNSSIAGGIFNGGTIVSSPGGTLPYYGYFGINLNGSQVAGGIANSGTINGYYASLLITNSSVTGGISNTAGAVMDSPINIVGSNSSVDVITNSGTIQVNESINPTTSGTAAIIWNQGSVGSITNNSSGTLNGIYSAPGYNSAWGIYNGTTGIIGAITNSGQITGDNSKGGIYTAGSVTSIVNNTGATISGGYGIQIDGGITGSITNSGSIAGALNGVYVTSGSLPTLLNNGTITSAYANGIQVAGGAVGSITNNSIVTGATAGSNAGIDVTGGAVTSIANNTGATISGGYGVYINGGSVGLISNSGIITGTTTDGLYTAASSLTITNNGVIGGASNGLNNNGTIVALSNAGTLTAGGGSTPAAIYNQNNGTIATLNNSGTISGSGSNSVGIVNYGVITTLNNTGTISANGTNSESIFSSGLIANLINTGTISGLMQNSGGVITNLANSQGAGNTAGALNYTGTLPTNYNIIINSATHYGQLAVTSPTGSTTFGISALSAVGTGVLGSYLHVLTGLTNTNLGLSGSSITSTSNGYGYTLSEEGTTGIWDLSVLSASPAPGPSLANTQASVQNTAQALQGTYTLQNSVLANSFSYDCSVFGENDVCVSAGGRNTAVSAANGLNNTSALLIAAYRAMANVRIGAYADQNLSVNNAGSTVNLGNNTPLLGLFTAWNERLDGTGTEVKATIAYGQKNTTMNRSVVGTGATASEAGSGSSTLNSQGAQITAKYGFGVAENVIVSPYIGMRYTQNNMNGYTEGTNSTVTAPLTYSALNTNATTALAGISASYKFIPQAGAFASAGVETDTNTANGSYYGTNSTIAGLTPVNFNSNPVKTRPTAMLGAYYDVEKNQRLGINAIYRQEPYQGVSTTTVMATYTVGL